jgi:hypothetical protein
VCAEELAGIPRVVEGPAGQASEENRAERVQIRAEVDRILQETRLLGGAMAGRVEGSVERAHLIGNGVDGDRIDEPRSSVRRHDDVRRLDGAVDDPIAVKGVERPKYVQADTDDSLERRSRCGPLHVERVPFDERTQDPNDAVGTLDVGGQDQPRPHGALRVRRRQAPDRAASHFLDDNRCAAGNLAPDAGHDRTTRPDHTVDLDPVTDRGDVGGVPSQSCSSGDALPATEVSVLRADRANPPLSSLRVRPPLVRVRP